MKSDSQKKGLSRRKFIEASAAAAAGFSLGASAVGKNGAPLTAVSTTPAPAKPTVIDWPLVPYAAGAPRYFSDFEAGGPSGAFSNEWDTGRWRVLPFQSEQTSGVMIVAAQDADCPDLALRLPFQGWYAIHIGLMSSRGRFRIQARLNGDSVFSLITNQPMQEFDDGKYFYPTNEVQSLFWKYADLQNETLHLSRLLVVHDSDHPASQANLRYPAWVAYVNVVPMTPLEVRELQADRARTDTRRLIAAHDVTTPAAGLMWSSEDDIRREIEPYRNTDFFRMDWEGGKGDLTHYPSKIGRMVTFDWRKGYYNSHELGIAQVFQSFQRRNIDPFRIALNHAHQIGMEFHASYRVSGFLYPPPRDERNRDGVFWRQPEWRGTGRDGKRTPRISYAFSGVRKWVVSLLQEMAQYPIDGITILYCRRPPVVEYEAPIVESFRKKFGLDPFSLDDRDRRWLSHRAEFVTGFMREVRTAMDDISERQRRSRLQVSAVVMGTEAANLYYAMDLRAWIREGLVDWIIPYRSGDELTSASDSFADARDARFFVDLAKGSRCKVAPNMMPRVVPPASYLERASGLYREGVDGLYFWDTYERCDFSESWSALRRLGHRDEIEAWLRAGKPPPRKPATDTLKKLGDWDISYATPG